MLGEASRLAFHPLLVRLMFGKLTRGILIWGQHHANTSQPLFSVTQASPRDAELEECELWLLIQTFEVRDEEEGSETGAGLPRLPRSQVVGTNAATADLPSLPQDSSRAFW